MPPPRDTARKRSSMIEMLQKASETDSKPASRRYVLITPCRDEAKYARRTLDSVAAQSLPPALWVIVDDGSRDGTPAILEEYAERFPYIKVVRRSDRGF